MTRRIPILASCPQDQRNHNDESGNDVGKKNLIIPIPKNPYYRIGPLRHQDWYRQVRRTINLARTLRNTGGDVIIAIISAFHPNGKTSEAKMYLALFRELAPDLTIRLIYKTSDTIGQVEEGFRLAEALNANVHFVAAWMQLPRIRYLTANRKADFYGAFGIPQPAFAIIDPLCLVFQPVTDVFGLTHVVRSMVINRRKKGLIL